MVENFFWGTFIFSENSFAIGEKYSLEGHSLGAILLSSLVEQGVCKNGQDCNDKEIVFGEHGDAVNISIYGLKDPKIISELLRKSISFSSTSEVLIRVMFYYSKKSENLGIKSLTAKPDVYMEVR